MLQGFTRALSVACIGAAMTALPVPANAEDLDQLKRAVETLRTEIESMRREHKAEIEALRGTPAARPASAQVAPGAPAAPADVTQARPSHSRVGTVDPLDPSGLKSYRVPGVSDAMGQSAFNPAISVIVDGAFFRDNRRARSNDLTSRTAGFAGGHDHGDGDHDHGGFRQGFNLREAEISFSASVDRYFDALAIMTVDDRGTVELEEAYGVTRSLPAGTQLKFGKFLSDVGYINRQHPHDWDFTDRPLFSELLFGDHGIQEVGLQASWVPPTPFYTRLGVEVLQGTTEGIARFEGTERGLRDKKGPRLYTGFIKVAPDLGHSHAVQGGLFGGFAAKWQATEEHGSRYIDADGKSWFAGTDLVYRYDAGRSFGDGDVKLQAEYAYRERSYNLLVTPRTGPHAAEALTGEYRDRQDGLYVQGMYGIAPRWQAGLRYDLIGLTNRIADERFGSSQRYTAALSFFPTEFSRLRLQLSHGRFATAEMNNIVQAAERDRETATQVYLQYTLSLGAHGAHQF